MTLLITLTIILALIGLIVLGLNNANAKVKKAPLAYPMETYLAQPEGEEGYITREDGTKIRYITTGSGQPIVLAHGYGISLSEWNIVSADLVQKGYKVIMFDQRGHGKSTIGTDGIGSQSMASDYKAVLEYFDVKDGIIVGHSMGGFLLTVFMLTYPEIVQARLKGAMLMATFAGDINRKNLQNKVQIPLIKNGILIPIVKSEMMAIPFVRSLMGDKPDMGMVRGFLDVFLRLDHKVLIPILQAFGDESYYHRLGEIDLPVTVIVGSKDQTTPPFHSNDLAAGIKGAKLRRVEGKGHMLNWEAPGMLVEEIVALAEGQAVLN